MRHTLLAMLLATTACYDGFISESLETTRDRDLSGIAGPPDMGAVQPVERIPRGTFGAENTADGLAFPSLSEAARLSLFDVGDVDAPIYFFTRPQNASGGLGPLYNADRCVGCHLNADDNAIIAHDVDVGEALTTSSAITRAHRTRVTDQDSTDYARGTSALTLFGDYYPAERRFDGLEHLGGPVRHVFAPNGCFGDALPDESIGDHVVRAIGERAAPSYVGRGLMEAVYDGDIEALADPDDRVSSASTLIPTPACDGDCISGRAIVASSNIGGDTIERVARFGLRGTTATLIEVVAAGAHRDLGFTHPFAESEEQNPQNAGLSCDVAPDPELTASQILSLRDFVRNLAPPEMAPELLDETANDGLSRDVREGARLFGVDLDAFLSRVQEGGEAVGFGDPDADRGIASDRLLNCVGCHTPIMVTGVSPAKVGGEQLSHRWVPMFSDLLVHHMGTFPPDLPAGDIESTHPFFAGVSRNLADYALPEGNSAVEEGEWRTPPLLAFGKIGPPYLHDGRVFLNPLAPTYFYYGSRTADEAGLTLEERRIEISGVESAIRAAIELHDLPQPPDRNLDGLPDYDLCPPLPPDRDWCQRESQLRSEARNVMEKWHALTDAEQARVVAFLMAL